MVGAQTAQMLAMLKVSDGRAAEEVRDTTGLCAKMQLRALCLKRKYN